MNETKSLSAWLQLREMSFDALLEQTQLDKKILEAILHGRYTPSPQQRLRVAEALGVEPELIQWGHTTTVESIAGHGPQFGRTP